MLNNLANSEIICKNIWLNTRILHKSVQKKGGDYPLMGSPPIPPLLDSPVPPIGVLNTFPN